MAKKFAKFMQNLLSVCACVGGCGCPYSFLVFEAK